MVSRYLVCTSQWNKCEWPPSQHPHNLVWNRLMLGVLKIQGWRKLILILWSKMVCFAKNMFFDESDQMSITLYFSVTARGKINSQVGAHRYSLCCKVILQRGSICESGNGEKKLWVLATEEIWVWILVLLFAELWDLRDILYSKINCLPYQIA